MQLDSYTCDNCILQLEETVLHLFLRCNFAIEETVLHLFLRCNFARRCWLMIGITPPRTVDLINTLFRIRVRLKVPWRMEIIIIMSWCIWKSRNNWIFNKNPATVEACREMFKREMRLVCHRVKPEIGDRIRSWIQQSVS
jgi:hypothetical protein